MILQGRAIVLGSHSHAYKWTCLLCETRSAKGRDRSLSTTEMHENHVLRALSASRVVVRPLRTPTPSWRNCIIFSEKFLQPANPANSLTDHIPGPGPFGKMHPVTALVSAERCTPAPHRHKHTRSQHTSNSSSLCCSKHHASNNTLGTRVRHFRPPGTVPKVSSRASLHTRVICRCGRHLTPRLPLFAAVCGEQASCACARWFERAELLLYWYRCK